MGAICCSSHADAGRRAAQLEAMLARSPYRGEPDAVSLPELGIGIQQHRGEASLYRSEACICAVHGFLTAQHGNRIHESPAQQLAEAWHARGIEGLTALGGQFAFVLYARASREILFGRSVEASRPLFYRHDPAGIQLASEIRQLIATQDDGSALDAEGFVQTLCFYGTPDPERTAYQNVRRCPGGQVMGYQVATGHVQPVAALWQTPAQEPGVSHAEWAEELRDTLGDAIADTVPPWRSALLLSGGLDSASLWAQAQTGNTADCHALSLIYPGWQNDEQHYIDAIHQRCGTTGTTVDGRERLPHQRLGAEVAASDHWLWAGSTFQIDLLLETARKLQAGSIITGFGADEWLLSYRGYTADLFWEGKPVQAVRLALGYQGDGAARSSWAALRRLLGMLAYRLDPSLRQKLRPVSPPMWLAGEWADAWQTWHLQGMAKPGETLAKQQLDRLLAIRRTGVTSESFEQRVAQHGMDDRHPYLDRRIIELAYRIPPRLLDRRVWKSLQREAFRKLLPPRVVGREKATLQDTCRRRSPAVHQELGPTETWQLAARGIADATALCTWLSARPSQHLTSEVEFLVCAELFLRCHFS